MESLDKLAVCHRSVLDPSKLTTHHGRRRKCPPKALHNNMSPTRRRRRPLHLHWAVALMPPPLPQVETGRRTRRHQCPPRLPRSFFLHDFAPPPAIVRPWPRQRRRCGMPVVIRFKVFIVVVVVVAVILGLDILCCGHRRLSRCAVACLVAPPPLLPRRRHYCYCRANACLIAPLSRYRLVVASSPLLLRQCLSYRAGASLVVLVPLSFYRGIFNSTIKTHPQTNNTWRKLRLSAMVWGSRTES